MALLQIVQTFFKDLVLAECISKHEYEIRLLILRKLSLI